MNHRYAAGLLLALCGLPLCAHAEIVLITAPQTIGPLDTFITATGGGSPVALVDADIVVQGTTLTINGRHTLKSLSVQKDAGDQPGVVTHSQAFVQDYSGGPGSDLVFGASLTTLGNVAIGAGSAIDARGRGYSGDQGPGAGHSAMYFGGGGGYAGMGGSGAQGAAGGAAYGSPLVPTALGSGGAGSPYYQTQGGAGGGTIRLNVSGTLSVDGAITAAGAQGPSSAGGGSGGGIWITCGTLAGSGSITASGAVGSSYAGGGGGGRIAVEYSSSTYSGQIQAFGGPGYIPGGAGTVWLRPSAGRATLIVDNNGAAGEFTPISGATSLDANLYIRGAADFGDKSSGASLALSGDAHLQSGGILRLNDGPVTVGGNMDIQAGSSFNGNGLGYPGGQGPGAGVSAMYDGGGGGHGGAGGSGAHPGASGGNAYDSALLPAQLGSGGAGSPYYQTQGGAGGGAIRLIVGGALSIEGSIAANGATALGGGAGGGSGGGIWITCSTLAGAGIVTASGGEGVLGGGGGGGGRIAVEYLSSAFSGQFRAFGAPGAMRGGAGTLWLQPAGGRAIFIIDNDGSAGAITPFAGQLSLDADMYIRGSALAGTKAAGSGTALELTGDARLQSDAVLWLNDLPLTVGGAMEIQPGCAVIADGLGYAGGQGPGAGHSAMYTAGGAGYGGAGGAGSQGGAGGSPYGSPLVPTELGSGGGGAPYHESQGGAGGGTIRLNISGALSVDGTITANGAPAVGPGAGGGSGGGVWITCATLAGSGAITANGSAGYAATGGGGGGGRIAIYSCDIQMPPSHLSVAGGGGSTPGSQGSKFFGSSSINIFLQPEPATYSGGEQVSLVVDAAGDGPLNFRWYKDHEPLADGGRISGAATTQLTLSPIDCADAGEFYCVVEDSCGSFPTDPAAITVLAPSDYDGSGFVDTDDFTAFVIDFELGIDEADFDKTGFVDTDDFTAFVLAFEAGC